MKNFWWTICHSALLKALKPNLRYCKRNKWSTLQNCRRRAAMIKTNFRNKVLKKYKYVYLKCCSCNLISLKWNDLLKDWAFYWPWKLEIDDFWIVASLIYFGKRLVQDRNHYFGFGPIPKPKPKLSETFGRYSYRYRM